MKNFKVGDVVEVVNSGNTYSTYDRMFVKMGFKNQVKNDGFLSGMLVEVFAVDTHHESGIPLVGLQARNGSQGLMSTQGVRLHDSKPSRDAEFDIIRQFCDEVLGSHNIADRTIFKYLLERCCE